MAFLEVLYFIVFGAISLRILIWFILYALSVRRGDYQRRRLSPLTNLRRSLPTRAT